MRSWGMRGMPAFRAALERLRHAVPPPERAVAVMRASLCGRAFARRIAGCKGTRSSVSPPHRIERWGTELRRFLGGGRRMIAGSSPRVMRASRRSVASRIARAVAVSVIGSLFVI
jgi:hypothetical protein